ncbi:MAG: MerC domain-containing protein [Bacteroidia bacterium]|nr:MerC domain-containing protein [Bacteroidia bacterium]
MKAIDTVVKTQRIGFFLSLLCVIHCAITPLLLTMVPLAGSQLFHSPLFEFGLVAVSLIIAFFGIVRNARNGHSVFLPLAMVTVGTLCIIANFLLLPESAEIYAMTSGGLLIAGGQIINVRKAASCAHHEH